MTFSPAFPQMSFTRCRFLLSTIGIHNFPFSNPTFTSHPQASSSISTGEVKDEHMISLKHMKANCIFSSCWAAEHILRKMLTPLFCIHEDTAAHDCCTDQHERVMPSLPPNGYSIVGIRTQHSPEHFSVMPSGSPSNHPVFGLLLSKNYQVLVQDVGLITVAQVIKFVNGV